MSEYGKWHHVGKPNCIGTYTIFFGHGETIANQVGSVATLEQAELIVRLANLYFAGRKMAADHDATIEAEGDMPANRDYGLTEAEIAAGAMLNAVMAERDALLAALIDAEKVMAKNIYPKPDAGPEHQWSVLERVRAAISKAEGKDGVS